MSFDQEIQENFDTLLAELYAFDAWGSSYQGNSHSFKTGAFPAARRPLLAVGASTPDERLSAACDLHPVGPEFSHVSGQR